MSTLSESMTSSTERPIPLSVRDDLISKWIHYKGLGYWVIKDPVSLKYTRLHPEQFYILNLLNGERNPDEIKDEVHRQYPTLLLSISEIQQLISDLYRKGLLTSGRPGQGVTLIKQRREEHKKKLVTTFRNLMYLRLPGWDPETTLQWLYPYVKWMWRPWATMMFALLIVSSWILIGVQFEEFRSRLPEFQQFFGWPNLIYMWFVLGAAKVVHEFGHGLSCKHYGGECHGMGIMFLVFSPCLYCDVSDSWMLRNKWQRIIIGGAGMYIEVIMSAVAVWVWWFTKPGLLNHLALNLFFVSTVTTVIFNANPLMRFDGYYMMSDLLEIPNLRQKADKHLRDTFAWYCLGIESQRDPFMPETGKFWFIVYAISASLYRWFIMFGITLFLYTVLKPYDLQSIGVTLAVISVVTFIWGIVSNIYKIISAPRTEPMNYWKVSATLTVFAAVILGILLIPVPMHFEAPFIVEGYDVQHVRTTESGRLDQIYVEPGQHVEKGQLLASIVNLEKEDELNQLKNQRLVQEGEIKKYRALGDLAGVKVSKEELATIEERIAEIETQLGNMKVIAPISGTVVAPASQPEPKLSDSKKQLSRWFGTPLDAKNANCYLEEGTHMLSIAPESRYQAVLFIDQEYRNDFNVDQSVELKLEHLPDKTYQSKIERVAHGHLDYVPPTLSNKMGGELPTVTDKDGREKLTSTAYQAIVPLDEDVVLFRANMRGKARFLVSQLTTGQWIWRYFRKTFHFRL
ncbi:HlyD family efflux transporter periplasmic adaptor subunit [Gimesia fumaroli]|uniref:Transcription elongation factor GreA n=1 Tax=Gimesia fumaroli TaxID=2527976 RepID=A0A518IE97_9PLAN|nr:HlyD family efflux transporter periplasmic adaptor subunit [Gimesia fumaroli]QDV51424.1 transcription elongation factor GreA [Gimesia fumaroli]